VVFSPESIEKWKCTDDPGELEWTKASAWVGRTDGGSVLLHSDFAAIRRIDNLDRKKPRFWGLFRSLPKKTRVSRWTAASFLS